MFYRLWLTLCGLTLLMANAFAGITSYKIKDLPLPNGQTTVIPYTVKTPLILKICLSKISNRHCTKQYCQINRHAFEQYCVIPYINGLWLDKQGLYRNSNMLWQEAIDKLILNKGRYPVFYPATTKSLAHFIQYLLTRQRKGNSKIILRSLPPQLPSPRKDHYFYNHIGLLFLPNPYVVPGSMFNEMYGWDSFFIIKGLLASAEYVLQHPHSYIWLPSKQRLVQLNDNRHSHYYFRHYANALFQTAKGMVDNHIFEIHYYGGFIPNANRTYYLTRSQPPLFTEEALAVYHFHLHHPNFIYSETLQVFFTKSAIKTKKGNLPLHYKPSFKAWLKYEVLPAAIEYFRYWTDPNFTIFAEKTNPRVVKCHWRECKYPYIYRYYTDGVGPAPEVARSTKSQNRRLYPDVIAYFCQHPKLNPGHVFYRGDCQKPYNIYNLTQAYYASDRAIRMSGFDLSGRFGVKGQYAAYALPISLNSFLYQMGKQLLLISHMTHSNYALRNVVSKEFIKTFRSQINAVLQRTNGIYTDKIILQLLPTNKLQALHVKQPYLYATHLFPWWSQLSTQKEVCRMIKKTPLLSKNSGINYGVPTSLCLTGDQWDYPYAWAPVQYFIFQGLQHYHCKSSHQMIMAKLKKGWILANDLFFAHTGTLIEKYVTTDPIHDKRVSQGYAQAQHGFGWTNAVYLLFNPYSHN